MKNNNIGPPAKDDFWILFLSLLKKANKFGHWDHRIDFNQIKEDFRPKAEELIRIKTTPNPEDHRISEIVSFLSNDLYWLGIQRGIIIPWGKSLLDEIKVTEFGEKYLSLMEDHYFDSHKYIESLDHDVQEIDAEVLMFTSESMRAFDSFCDNASMVMLGCASEKLILVMIDSLIKKTPSNKNKQPKFVDFYENKRPFSQILNEFIKYIESHNKELFPPNGDLWEVFNNKIKPMSAIFRIERNNSGHPRLKKVNHKNMSYYLHIFRFYIIACYEIIDYWSDKKE